MDKKVHTEEGYETILAAKMASPWQNEGGADLGRE